MKTKKLNFSKAEMMEIHEAIHNKRRRVVEVRGEKLKVTKFNDLREVKYKSLIFTQFQENNANFAADNTTIVIDKNTLPNEWPVIDNNKIYTNKVDYYGNI